ncbi:N-6 DNA methylase, partial [Veillonella sp.]
EQEGKRGGEFFTPSCIVRTLVEILQPYKGRVYEQRCLGLIQYWGRCA